MYIFVYIYIYIHSYIHIHTHIHMCVYMYICIGTVPKPLRPFSVVQRVVQALSEDSPNSETVI